MHRFIDGEDRMQLTLLPHSLGHERLITRQQRTAVHGSAGDIEIETPPTACRVAAT
jgi:hypothetical protein